MVVWSESSIASDWVREEADEGRRRNILVPVRNPHALAHVVAALQAGDGREVVVMTARLIGVDVSEEAAGESAPTAYERRLLAAWVGRCAC